MPIFSVSVSGPNGVDIFEAAFAQSITKWTGKRHMTLATATTDQMLVDITTNGIVTVNQFMIVSDQLISVKLGISGSNVGIPLLAGAPLLISGVTLAAISLSNTSGNTANIDYALAGS